MFTDLFPIEWSEFHFLRPQFLWLIGAASLIFLISLFNLRQNISWKSVIAPHLRPYMVQKGSGHIKLLMNIFTFLFLTLGALALAGPTWKKVEIPGQQLETPLIILLDLGEGMLKEDIQPSRLERAKFKIIDLLEADPGARTALIAFAGSAHTVVPLTEDYEIIKSHIETLKPSVMPVRGHDLEEAFLLADSLVQKTTAPGTLLVFSDQLSDEDFGIVSQYLQSSTNQLRWVPARAMGDLSEEDGQTFQTTLSQLSSLDRVNIHPMTLDKSDMEAIRDQVKNNLIFTEKPEDSADDWRDAGILLIIPMIVLLLFWFRKGWVLYGLVLVIFTSCGEVETFEDLWYTTDYQGQKASNQGDFEKAAALYSDPMRKGVAYFKAGNYEDAIREFRQDTSANGQYNLGLSYYQNGDYDLAELAFGKAVELDPNLEEAKNAQQLASTIVGENKETLDPNQAEELEQKQAQNNIENKDPEDLGGGGQEATEKDMETQRKEETVTTDIRKAEELDEVPDDLKMNSEKMDPGKVLLRKTDDDPSLFLQKKFQFQIKKREKKEVNRD